MYCGILNRRAGATCRVLVCGAASAPTLRAAGAPLKGEELFLHQSEILASDAELHICLDGAYWLDRVDLTLGARCAPVAVTALAAGVPLFTYHAETGKTVTEKALSLPIGETVSELTLRFSLDFSSLVVENITLYGAEPEGDRLYPFPTEVTPGKGTVALSAFGKIVADTPDGTQAGEILSEKLKEDFDWSAHGAGEIRFENDPELAQNAYRLRVFSTGAVIGAADLRGFVIGAETFLKLIRDGAVPEITVKDAPAVSFRGVHLMLPDRTQLAFTRRLVRDLLSPMGYNAVVLEFAGGMRFDSHPEITRAVLEAKQKSAAEVWPPFPHGTAGGAGVLEKQEVAELVAYIRRFGIDVIPEVQSLGHVQYLTLAHPEIAERAEEKERPEVIDERFADIPPKDFYAHSYCPSNEASYRILFDLMDEIIEVCAPLRYVHIGHDEVYQIGVCPKCREKDPAELFAADVNRIYRYLTAKNLKVMMWADMLQPVTTYRTVAVAKKIPKDILLIDFIWYFHTDKNIEENLLREGFSVVFGNLYSSHYPRFASRIRQKGVVGGVIATWAPTEEAPLAREGKLYDLLYTAQMLWSPEYCEKLRGTYDRLIAGRIPALREKLSGQRSPLLHGGAVTSLFRAESDAIPESPTALEIAFPPRCFDSILFSHTATEQRFRKPFHEAPELARYLVRYADGTEIAVPVRYGEQVGFCHRRQNEPLSNIYFRHTGYEATFTADGESDRDAAGRIRTIYRYEWINPRPTVPVTGIVLAGDTDPLQLFVKAVDGVVFKNRTGRD